MQPATPAADPTSPAAVKSGRATVTENESEFVTGTILRRAHAPNKPSSLYTGWPEDHSQTTPDGGPHWHINILDAKSERASKEEQRVRCMRSRLRL